MVKLLLLEQVQKHQNLQLKQRQQGRKQKKQLVPNPAKLSNSQKVLTNVFVADDAFDLKTHMMKPFPSQNFPLDERNCRLSPVPVPVQGELSRMRFYSYKSF